MTVDEARGGTMRVLARLRPRLSTRALRAPSRLAPCMQPTPPRKLRQTTTRLPAPRPRPFRPHNASALHASQRRTLRDYGGRTRCATKAALIP